MRAQVPKPARPVLVRTRVRVQVRPLTKMRPLAPARTQAQVTGKKPMVRLQAQKKTRLATRTHSPERSKEQASVQ
jgi:hypothetical protein